MPPEIIAVIPGLTRVVVQGSAVYELKDGNPVFNVSAQRTLYFDRFVAFAGTAVYVSTLIWNSYIGYRSTGIEW